MHEQGSPEWLQERCGKVTASRIADVMAKIKTGYGAGRANYMAEIIAERLTNVPKQGFTNEAMRWGTETEPQARAMYEFQTGLEVTETGFVPHPVIEGTGASPDGLVGDSGLIEIKCPNTATHIDTLRGSAIDRKYVLQMHWQMICTGRDWCDFVSFDPRLSLAKQMHVRRVHRDAELCEEITAEVTRFLTELNETVAELERLYPDGERLAA